MPMIRVAQGGDRVASMPSREYCLHHNGCCTAPANCKVPYLPRARWALISDIHLIPCQVMMCSPPNLATRDRSPIRSNTLRQDPTGWHALVTHAWDDESADTVLVINPAPLEDLAKLAALASCWRASIPRTHGDFPSLVRTRNR